MKVYLLFKAFCENDPECAPRITFMGNYNTYEDLIYKMDEEKDNFYEDMVTNVSSNGILSYQKENLRNPLGPVIQSPAKLVGEAIYTEYWDCDDNTDPDIDDDENYYFNEDPDVYAQYILEFYCIEIEVDEYGKS